MSASAVPFSKPSWLVRIAAGVAIGLAIVAILAARVARVLGW